MWPCRQGMAQLQGALCPLAFDNGTLVVPHGSSAPGHVPRAHHAQHWEILSAFTDLFSPR